MVKKNMLWETLKNDYLKLVSILRATAIDDDGDECGAGQK